MKALLAAESKDIITLYTNLLEEANYDVIAYRWLLKAIDNIEEIRPHLIVVNPADFPRQWKTLFQHIKTILDYSPQFYLINERGISKEDEEAAHVFNANIITEETFLKTQDVKEPEIVEAIFREDLPVHTVPQMIFTFPHPKTGIIICGTIEHYKDPMFSFVPESMEDLETLRFGQKILNGIISIDGEQKKVDIQIQGIHKAALDFCITKHS